MKTIAMSTAIVLLAFASLHSSPTRDDDSQVVVQSSLLNGLSAGALFPFIDSTPSNITKAHIAITDATSSCSAGAAAPTNIQILAGVAGGSLVNVMTAATNTGIGSATQCVFHVTIVPGSGGVPAQVTDIVAKNAGSTALTGVNTVSARIAAERHP
jgi:hypothetical protein